MNFFNLRGVLDQSGLDDQDAHVVGIHHHEGVNPEDGVIIDVKARVGQHQGPTQPAKPAKPTQPAKPAQDLDDEESSSDSEENGTQPHASKTLLSTLSAQAPWSYFDEKYKKAVARSISSCTHRKTSATDAAGPLKGSITNPSGKKPEGSDCSSASGPVAPASDIRKNWDIFNLVEHFTFTLHDGRYISLEETEIEAVTGRYKTMGPALQSYANRAGLPLEELEFEAGGWEVTARRTVASVKQDGCGRVWVKRVPEMSDPDHVGISSEDLNPWAFSSQRAAGSGEH